MAISISGGVAVINTLILAVSLTGTSGAQVMDSASETLPLVISEQEQLAGLSPGYGTLIERGSNNFRPTKVVPNYSLWTTPFGESGGGERTKVKLVREPGSFALLGLGILALLLLGHVGRRR